jgi:FkbH-like protein
LKELRDRGVVLAVCSKNNRADAIAPFRSRDGMVLKLEDFASFKANWRDKATNLPEIAKDLSLGIDSFVFLDDNAFERNLIREQLADVIVPEGGSDPWSMIATLRRGMYFEAVDLTQEDLHRNASYQVTAVLRSAQESPGSLQSFLEGLGMTCAHGAVNEAVLPRVTQLVNKTNQFNLTTRRYTIDEVRKLAASNDWWCHWFRLADRLYQRLGFSRCDNDGNYRIEASSPTLAKPAWIAGCRAPLADGVEAP